MNILILSYTAPESPPNELCTYLRGSTGNQTDLIQCLPRKSPIITIRKVYKEVKELDIHYDLLITSNPFLLLIGTYLRRKKLVDKVIYWRVDYYPAKDQIYQLTEKRARLLADEIWSIADPDLPRIEASLGTTREKTIHVPYLSHNIPIFHEDRENFMLWVGPDLDESRPLCWEASRKVGINFEIHDSKVDKFNKTQERLEELLKRAKVGVSLYRPHYQKKSSSYYCDSPSIRKFLSYGVPVITNDVPPTFSTIVEGNCGSVVQWSVGGLVEGLNYCLENTDQLSQNALKAARKYTFHQWFSDHQIL